MRSGIAGINIVSAYMTMAAMQLKMISVFQAYAGMFSSAIVTSDDDKKEKEEDDGNNQDDMSSKKYIQNS
jgi:hypothetical protein